MRTSLLAAACTLLVQAVPSVMALRPPTGTFSFRKGMKQHLHPDPDRLGAGTFTQNIDHDDPSKGTFEQRYWWDAKSWKGPGSPVFVFNPGETAAEDFRGYLDNGTIPGLYADLFGGAVILIEHRYWGKSVPYDTLTAETLQPLNIKQSALDMTNFAKNIALEFDDSHGGANAADSPWVLIGGSYSGALAAWTSQIDPGTFYAYHASSAVVQAIYHFWEYFGPIEEALPRNCSADVRAVISYIDDVFANGTSVEIQDLKDKFGLGDLEHSDDFAAQVAGPLWAWQGDQQSVLDFCDHIELFGSNTVSNTHKGGVGLNTALDAYADYINSTTDCHQYDCNTYNNDDYYNQPDDIESGNRQWDWMLCDTPFGWWQSGPSESDGTNIISSLLTAEHFQRQCPLKFPKTDGFVDGSSAGFTVKHTNQYTGGWSADFNKVMFCNGEFDPWRSATVSSVYQAGGEQKSTDGTPIFIVKGGVHVPDLIIDDIPAEESVVEKEVAVMKKWLAEYYDKKKKETSDDDE